MIMFGKYADFYDFLYQDKDYEGECDAVEEIFKKYAKFKVNSILDLGCGTGNHAFILHKRGYKIVGVDRSETMLANATQKLSKISDKKNIKFEKGDIRNWKNREKFDAVIMMFAVLGYQRADKDVLSTFSIVKRHLKTDGLFIFDIWYGPAVLAQKPTKRVKTVDTPTGKITRKAFSEINTLKHICTVHYQLNRKITEEHQMRYFFRDELAVFLKKTGLELMKLGSFPNWKKEATPDTWNIFGIARAA